MDGDDSIYSYSLRIISDAIITILDNHHECSLLDLHQMNKHNILKLVDQYG